MSLVLREIAVPGPPGSGYVRLFVDESDGEFYAQDSSGTVTPVGSIGPAGPQGDPGDDGREIELQVSGTHIQWRYEGETWENLIELSELEGDDGREVELQVTATYIQWRYAGEAWENLIALSELEGADGVDGTDGVDGRTILSGSGAPASGLGEDGDFYLDTDVWDVYGPKDSGAWGAGTSLIGPAGGVDDLGDLDDVDTTGASDDDVLTYDDGEWVPRAPASPGLTVELRTVTENDTPDDTDTGKRLNVTDEATISLNNGLAAGAWFVVRAETEDEVTIDTTGTATMSPDGPLELVPFTAATCTHVGGGAWQVEGAFEEGS